MQKGINSNQLKLIAVILMSIDHIGAYLFPHISILRIIGRLAMPIFAYLISEGFSHTRSKLRYFFSLFAAGLISQPARYLYAHTWELNILLVFAFSVGILLCFQWALHQRRAWAWTLPAAALAAAFFVSEVLPALLSGTVLGLEYGFFGIALPVLVYWGRERQQKLLLSAFCLILISLRYGYLQWYCLLSLPLLYFYNGERGSRSMKYFFYIYYPFHLVLLYFLRALLYATV